MKRTDIHRPAAIVPQDYEEVAFLPHDEMAGAFRVAQYALIRKHMERTGGHWSGHEHGGSCDIYGNVQAMTHVVFYHAKSNTYIRTGHICADKVGMNFDRAAFTRFVKCAKEARERQAGKNKARVLLGDYGLARSWEIFDQLEQRERDDWAATWKNATNAEKLIYDIVGKFVRYGSISEKQQEFLRKLEYDIDHEAERKAQRAAEDALLTEVPSGRVEISGKILTTKDVITDFGATTKMLVMDDRRFKVWGTVPSAIGGASRGDKVRFTATVEPKQGEVGFGFFKRPGKASVIEQEVAA